MCTIYEYVSLTNQCAHLTRSLHTGKVIVSLFMPWTWLELLWWR